MLSRLQKIIEREFSKLKIESPADVVEIGKMAEEMKQKGYSDPVGMICDGLVCVVFHGPDASTDFRWMDANETPFQMRVLDCQDFSQSSLMYALGGKEDAFEERFDLETLDAEGVVGSFDEGHVESCVLGYPKKPGEIPQGLQWASRDMEDLWAIFLHDGYYYFLRSWTGKVRLRAKVEFREQALFVTEVAKCREEMDDSEPVAGGFYVQQVDFLIKSLLFNCACPAPVPAEMSRLNDADIRNYAFTEYGRLGRFPCFEATDQFRICLNGSVGKFETHLENGELLHVLSAAIHEKGRALERKRLLDELKDRTLLFSFLTHDEEFRAGNPDRNSQVFFPQQEWGGKPCVFAYTDPTYRIGPSHGCFGVEGKGLAEIVQQFEVNEFVIINPAGPVTCVLGQQDLQAMAIQR